MSEQALLLSTGPLAKITGLFQLIAIYCGMVAAGAHWLLAIVAVLATGFVPILGPILASWGANQAWGWPYAVAVPVFFWYAVLFWWAASKNN